MSLVPIATTPTKKKDSANTPPLSSSNEAVRTTAHVRPKQTSKSLDTNAAVALATRLQEKIKQEEKEKEKDEVEKGEKEGMKEEVVELPHEIIIVEEPAQDSTTPREIPSPCLMTASEEGLTARKGVPMDGSDSPDLNTSKYTL